MTTNTTLRPLPPVAYQTGFSRPARPEFSAEFLSPLGDFAEAAEFIRAYRARFLSQHQPLFLIGESYGTWRVSGVSGSSAYPRWQGLLDLDYVLPNWLYRFETQYTSAMRDFYAGVSFPVVNYLNYTGVPNYFLFNTLLSGRHRNKGPADRSRIARARHPRAHPKN